MIKNGEVPAGIGLIKPAETVVCKRMLDARGRKKHGKSQLRLQKKPRKRGPQPTKFGAALSTNDAAAGMDTSSGSSA